MKKETDLLIVGGGLAGLSLGLQVRKQCPELDITLAEERSGPLPEFVGKVGESTVEVGAHYLGEVIGQRDYLNEYQLKKFGLRFFFNDGCDDLSQADEVGASDTFDIPTYQVERGSLENHLSAELEASGVDLKLGTRVTDISFGSGDHLVSLRNKTGSDKLKARWVVDASGRKNLMRRKLKLERSLNHNGSAIWFRVDKRISVDDWSSNNSWQNKFGEDRRWLSTNHLMGPGYWVWIIPLAGGATSFGIVFDEKIHAWENFVKFDAAMSWLRQHQPMCAAALEGSKPLDYRVLKNYAFDSSQTFSDDGWGLSGESGVFLDPFYSPGTDFIAYSNTFLTDLISREKQGENIVARSFMYRQMFESISRSTEQLYFGQYGGFGSQRMMTLKMIWDYSYYWGVLGFLFFSNSLTDMQRIRDMNPDLMAIRAVNDEVQDAFRAYAAEQIILKPQGIFTDQFGIPILQIFNAIMECPRSAENASETLADNIAKIRIVAAAVKSLLKGNRRRNAECQDLLGDLEFSLTA